MRHNLLQLLTYASLAISSLVMPLFAAQLGASWEELGVIGAAYGLASFLSNYAFGRAGDIGDRRIVLIVGFLASGIAFTAQALAHTPLQLLATRFAAGFAVGIIPPALAAYAYDVKRPLGKFTSFNAAGWLLASLLIIAVGLLPKYAWRLPAAEAVRRFLVEDVGLYPALFVASGILCLIGVHYSRRLPPMRLGLRVPFFPRDVLARNYHVYLAVFIRHVGASGIWVVYPLYVIQLGGDLALVGWVNVVNMVSQILVLRNVERHPRLGDARVLITIGLVLSAVTFFAFTLATNVYQLLPLQVVLGVSFATLWLGSMKEVMERNVERATSTGLLNASISLSNVVGPLAAGFAAAAVGFHGIMYGAAALTLLAMALFATFGRAIPRPGAPAAPQGGPAGEVGP